MLEMENADIIILKILDGRFEVKAFYGALAGDRRNRFPRKAIGKVSLKNIFNIMYKLLSQL